MQQTTNASNIFKIELGRTVATPGAVRALQESDAGMGLATHLLYRHQSGDWGDLDSDDREANDRAAALGGERILSAYDLDGGGKLWIITEADRSVTTILCPEEY